MTTRGPNQCASCKHLKSSPINNGYSAPWECRSFPDGIPVEIVGGGDHRQPVGGERLGILFEKAEGPEADFWWNAWAVVYDDATV